MIELRAEKAWLVTVMVALLWVLPGAGCSPGDDGGPDGPSTNEWAALDDIEVRPGEGPCPVGSVDLVNVRERHGVERTLDPQNLAIVRLAISEAELEFSVEALDPLTCERMEGDPLLTLPLIQVQYEARYEGELDDTREFCLSSSGLTFTGWNVTTPDPTGLLAAAIEAEIKKKLLVQLDAEVVRKARVDRGIDTELPVRCVDWEERNP